MTRMNASVFENNPPLTLLSSLLLSNHTNGAASDPILKPEPSPVELTREQFDAALELADSHHVTIRAMQVLSQIYRRAGDATRKEWADSAMQRERARIENAVEFMERICQVLKSEGCDAVVIKSLDHWPDLGSDLDLYTDADPARVIACMSRHFESRLAERSWGDRLASKWNFVLTGLPEAVEIHMQRLGQTGEHVALAQLLLARSTVKPFGSRMFPVLAAEDRLMISTLQRMYRHFNARLCDMVDNALLVENGMLDYGDLQRSAEASGIWEGVATYLAVIVDYAAQFRGVRLRLPDVVLQSASFGGDRVYFSNGYLRFPILPDSARLYASELTTLMRQGRLRSTARLSLLPWLATAAALGEKITGSDKGIW